MRIIIFLLFLSGCGKDKTNNQYIETQKKGNDSFVKEDNVAKEEPFLIVTYRINRVVDKNIILSLGPGHVTVEKYSKSTKLRYGVNIGDKFLAFEVTLEPQEAGHRVVNVKKFAPNCGLLEIGEYQDNYMNGLDTGKSFYYYTTSKLSDDDAGYSFEDKEICPLSDSPKS